MTKQQSASKVKQVKRKWDFKIIEVLCAQKCRVIHSIKGLFINNNNNNNNNNNLYFKRVTPITIKSILPIGPLKNKIDNNKLQQSW